MLCQRWNRGEQSACCPLCAYSCLDQEKTVISHDTRREPLRIFLSRIDLLYLSRIPKPAASSVPMPFRRRSHAGGPEVRAETARSASWPYLYQLVEDLVHLTSSRLRNSLGSGPHVEKPRAELTSLSCYQIAPTPQTCRGPSRSSSLRSRSTRSSQLPENITISSLATRSRVPQTP